jgi:ubiquinone/menaquinone biosynthesis C-methylase UbiE
MNRSTPTAVGKDSARRQFDEWAKTYDRSLLNEIVFFPSIRICQEEIERWKIDRGEPDEYRLLDVGCGTGKPLSMFLRDEKLAHASGLDYSQVMVDRAQQRLAVHGERAAVLHGDAENMPFADAGFDIVTCCNSFHHYPDQARAMCEFHRVLRPGGRLVLVDGFRDNLIGWFIFDVVVTLIERHVLHASWTRVRSLATAAGFTDIHHRKANVLAPLLVTVAHRVA